MTKDKHKVCAFILFILFSFFIGNIASLVLGEEAGRMGIALVSVGKIDKQILEDLKEDLSKIFDKEIFIGKDMPGPDYAFNKKRGQYLASTILDRILQQRDYASFERVLAVVDDDLYVSELNFVFGLAGSRGAIISVTRLKAQYYGLPENSDIFRKRTLSEAVHELGHTYGLGHCENPSCVMFFSNSLIDTDRKGYQFCMRCKKQRSGLNE